MTSELERAVALPIPWEVPSPAVSRALSNATDDLVPHAQQAHLFTLEVTSTRAPEFMDITAEVLGRVRETGIENGHVVVFSRHTTAAIKIQENEPLLLEDMTSFLERTAPRGVYYRHNDFAVRTVNMHIDESPNGHAHCQHLFLGASETIPIVQGECLLGEWQSVFVVELDRPRQREVLIQVVGS